MKPGNAGGGKDPDFWRASEDDEERVIGDEPDNTREDQDSSEEALSQDCKAKAEPAFRFYLLDDKICRGGMAGGHYVTWLRSGAARGRRATAAASASTPFSSTPKQNRSGCVLVRERPEDEHG
jgi:hypothetical protein